MNGQKSGHVAKRTIVAPGGHWLRFNCKMDNIKKQTFDFQIIPLILPMATGFH